MFLWFMLIARWDSAGDVKVTHACEESKQAVATMMREQDDSRGGTNQNVHRSLVRVWSEFRVSVRNSP